GQKGVNNPKDVLIVQKLINKNIFKLIPRRPLTVNGICDSNTISAIEDFQRRVVGMRQLDGFASCRRAINIL
ncbi:MAG: hypothetical protein SVR94_19565, partial [Pseudomonadota bacterium]|nr:hypothetical protein [Pseudomonadota bacterium]